MVKKHLIGLFVKTNEAYVRIKKSTQLTIAMNGETEEFDFIADESPTTELKKYAPSIEQDLSMYKEEKDYKFFFDKFYNMASGADAHVKAMVVFMQEGDKSGGFKAWETDAIINFTDLNAVDSKINFTLNFGGTIKKGVAKVTGEAPDLVPTFEAAV